MKNLCLATALVIFGLATFTPQASAAVNPLSKIFVSPQGLDTNDGSLGSPVKTLGAAFSLLSSHGDDTLIQLKAGTEANPNVYVQNTPITWPNTATKNVILSSSRPLSAKRTIIQAGGILATGSSSALLTIAVPLIDGSEIRGITFQGFRRQSGDGAVVETTIISHHEMFNCRFINNATFGSGGALSFRGVPDSSNTIFNGSVSLFDCYFAGNTAELDGGAIFVEATGTTSVLTELENCEFEANEAHGKDSGGQNDDDFGVGGAILSSGSKAILISHSCCFYGNSARIEGGAVFIEESTWRSANDMFVRNTSQIGGAIIVAGPVGAFGANAKISHATVFANTATFGAGGLSIFDASIIEITSSIFHANTTTGGHPDINIATPGVDFATITHSLLSSAPSGSTQSDNLLGVPPEFINPTPDNPATLDLRLGSNSPCIGENFGPAIPFNSDIRFDKRGIDRVQFGGNEPDMGALEHIFDNTRPHILTPGVTPEGASQFVMATFSLGFPLAEIGDQSQHPSVFDRLIQFFGGAYDDTQMRIFRFNPTTQGYNEAAGIKNITQGGGSAIPSWITTRNFEAIPAFHPRSHWRPTTFTLPPNSWTQVGNPYWAPLPLATIPDPNFPSDPGDAAVAIYTESDDFMHFDDVQATAFIVPELYRWDPAANGYVVVGQTGQMDPLTAYWIFNHSDKTVFMGMLPGQAIFDNLIDQINSAR